MRQVRVSKESLVGILTVNREEHRKIFLEAQKAYREVVIKTLDEQLALARVNHPFNLRTITSIDAPRDHTNDYDRALHMLEMSVDETMVLDAQEFAQYVEDNWGWSRSWAATNSAYVTSQKLSKHLGDED